MQKIQNLPNKFPVQNLAKFAFGMPDGKDDPILDACALRISPIAEFLDENKSILVGDRGTGKTAVFRLLSEGKLKFNNSEDLRQIYIPIDEDLAYKTLREYIAKNISDPANNSTSPHRIVWELFIFGRCLDGLQNKFKGNAKFEDLQNSFYEAIGCHTQKKFSLIEIITQTKKTFGVKLEGGHLGYVIPNFYASVEPKRIEGDALVPASFLDLSKFKQDLNLLLANSKSVSYVLIDKLDEFVSGAEYQTQLATLQALIHCWRDFQSYPKIKLKLFLRRDLYERLDFSSVGKDKIDPRKVELRWTDEDIRQLIALRIFHNLAPFIKGKGLKIELNEEQLTIDKDFLREIRTLEAIPESERSLMKRLKRLMLIIRARLKQRKRDAYDARTINMHDMVHRAIMTVLLPRSVNHKTKTNKEEFVELTQYLSSHFQFSNGATTPRIILLYMQKCLEIARNYYSNNPADAILQNELGEYPIFLRDHLSEAYQEIRQLALQTILGLNHQWSRPATLLMQSIARSKNVTEISFRDAKKIIGKSMSKGEPAELANFFAFYEHAGLFYCCNRTLEVENRAYSIPIFFQRVQLDNG